MQIKLFALAAVFLAGSALAAPVSLEERICQSVLPCSPPQINAHASRLTLPAPPPPLRVRRCIVEQPDGTWVSCCA